MSAGDAEPHYEKTYRREVIRLVELVAPDGPPVITDTNFEDCDIHGPAVIAPMERIVFDGVGFEGTLKELFIDAEIGRGYMGVIGINNARFFNCRFHRTGILVPADAKEDFIAALTRGTRSRSQPPDPET